MTIKQTYNWIINNKNDENDGNLEISEEGTIKVVVFQVMFLIIGIVMIEMTARKNSISILSLMATFFAKSSLLMRC